jgi:phosphatidylserine/phosphatidylglycerophosphate/cardiolipin synthase-like enzyme
VVQELFRNAAQSVLVAGYELYQAEPLFRALADRMAAKPGLRVRMFLNIRRPAGDTTADRELIAGFCHRFHTKHWPTGRALPEVYFDPRSISTDSRCRAVLHAKCVVIDQQVAFVSSANFTEAAQERNIEVGLLARQNRIAERLVGFFESMLARGHLKRVL